MAIQEYTSTSSGSDLRVIIFKGLDENDHTVLPDKVKLVGNDITTLTASPGDQVLRLRNAWIREDSKNNEARLNMLV